MSTAERNSVITHNNSSRTQRYIVIINLLQVTEDILRALPEIKQKMGPKWPDVVQILQRLDVTLQQEIHSDFNQPIVDLLAYGYHTPAEPVFYNIINKYGFDYRLITGKRRGYRLLQAGKVIPEEVLKLWLRVRDVSAKTLKQEG